ncbi:beta-1,3-N-acetylglucosaminyltransferase lunatic fringe-like [Anneissia japonica]|uniref:beta-1,3-N-acetylglucosaminyltransferase lunatic fringe-like n=1 Tax=Anneissia japonica TaxID=1529436 RepID=UPI0014257626|nr:beta-1,3-N-acetylglucosaminyltransferase lunatic fringe-like [Anneissia japonica]
MRITIKKVLAYICSVCIVDSVILCIYVSTNRDAQTGVFHSASRNIDLVDLNQHDRPYFMNEPHFERLIKEYRSQEEEPRRVLFADDRPNIISDEQLSNNSQTYQQNAPSDKVNLDPRWFENAKQGNESGVKTNYKGDLQPLGNKRTALKAQSFSHAKGINNTPTLVRTNQNVDKTELKLVDNQASKNSAFEIADLGGKIPLEEMSASENKIILKHILAAKERQNQPVYVNYVKLKNDGVQPVQVEQNSLELKREKRDDIVPIDGNSLSQSPAEVAAMQNLDDVFLAVKTTKKFHHSRLQVLLDTWVSIVPNLVYFFTDADDEEFQQKTNGHMINTKCRSLHVRSALCCKMAVMFDHFMASNKSWFCHVDDDNYLNIVELGKLLDLYQPHQQDIYLGRSSTLRPIEAYKTQTPSIKHQFWFGTGGAGVCVSRALAKKMVPYTSGGMMLLTCESIRMPDDVTIGYINEILLNVPMIHIKKMNSHLQDLWAIKPDDIKNQITLSYRTDSTNKMLLHNPAFSINDDPTRFKSIHCILYPQTSFCPKAQV